MNKFVTLVLLCVVVAAIEAQRGETGDVEQHQHVLRPGADVHSVAAIRERRSLKGFPFPFPLAGKGYIGKFGGLKGWKGIGIGGSSSSSSEKKYIGKFGGVKGYKGIGFGTSGSLESAGSNLESISSEDFFN